jgi:hypothetical protein
MTKETLELARQDVMDTLKSMEGKNDTISLAIRWGLLNNLRDINRRLEAIR